MTDYLRLIISITPFSTDASDLLAAFLCEIGFESFIKSEKENAIEAFIPKALYDPQKINDIIKEFPMPVKISFTNEIIEGRDWNEEWEKNYFKPILINNECVIHSSFHDNVPKAQYDIVIDPKMAFGTGHHATTANMVRLILEFKDLRNKVITDMGSGTGILAILCKLMGAEQVNAIEIDPFAALNAEENFLLNHCNIKMVTGDACSLSKIPKADILLANINRNIILEDIEKYVDNLKEGAYVLLSGFYKEDISKIMDKAISRGLKLEKMKEENNWVAICLKFEPNIPK